MRKVGVSLISIEPPPLNPEKHQTPLSDDRPGSVPTLEVISQAASSVGVMYRSHGPNTGSNPVGGQTQKKQNILHPIKVKSNTIELLVIASKLTPC